MLDRRPTSDLYDSIGHPVLTGEPRGQSLKQVAADLEMSESAVKVAVHRIRRRFGSLLRKEMAQVVEDPDDIEVEIRYLFDALESR